MGGLCMKDFNSSLLREKFTIYDPNLDLSEAAPVIALSNRMVVELRKDTGALEETLVVRAQNMHCCVRFAARLIQSYQIGGSILIRGVPFDWEAAWDAIVNDYEYAFNPQRWISVYHKGKAIFKKGNHNPFLDVIEKCDFENEAHYDFAIPMAEQAIKKSGKVLKVEYDANVALAMDFADDKGRCGIILRGPNRTTTFNYSAAPLPKSKESLSIPRCLTAAAAFLEGIQLAFLLGMNTEKIRLGIIERFSTEEKQTREVRDRLKRLSSEIAGLESSYAVRYRSEKPDFSVIVAEAEELAIKLLAPDAEE